MKTLQESLLSKSKITTAVADQSLVTQEMIKDWALIHISDLKSSDVIVNANNELNISKWVVGLQPTLQETGLHIPDYIKWDPKSSERIEFSTEQGDTILSFKNFPRHMGIFYHWAETTGHASFAQLPKNMRIGLLGIGSFEVNNNVKSLKGLTGTIDTLELYTDKFEEFKSSEKLSIQDVFILVGGKSSLKNLDNLPRMKRFTIRLKKDFNDNIIKRIYDMILNCSKIMDSLKKNPQPYLNSFENFSLRMHKDKVIQFDLA